MAKVLSIFLTSAAAITIIMLLFLDDAYFPPYISTETQRQKIANNLNPKITCRREKPTALSLEFSGYAGIKLITILFGRDGIDVAHISIFPQKIFKENDSVGFKFFARAKEGWKLVENLTAKERADYLKQITLSPEETVFFQKCLNPKTIV